MKKSLIYLSAVFVCCIFLTGCSEEKPETNQNTSFKEDTQAATDGTLTYSNLVGERVQNEVEKVLLSADISEKHVENLLLWINDFNECMKDCESYELVDEFVTREIPVVDYGEYPPMSTMWFKTNHRDYGDILCRIAAFELMQETLSVGNSIAREKWECYQDTQWLYSDWDAISGNPLIQYDDNDQSKYFTLFNPVMITPDCSADEMYSAISGEWKNREISFADSRASLITIWIQYENQTAAAHAGVLVESDEGLLFIEKTNPQAPWQATKFFSTDQVKKYMYESIHIEDVRYHDETGTYLVMQNDKKM